jgi:predicted transcriptional regulator
MTAQKSATIETNTLELAAEVVAAFVSKNSLPRAELSELLATVHTTLARLPIASRSPPPVAARQPAVPVARSITPGFLICLEDGKRFKTLKRHLKKLGMTPDQYRAKWNLPRDYPMVSPNYAAARLAAKRRELEESTRSVGNRGRSAKVAAE